MAPSLSAAPAAPAAPSAEEKCAPSDVLSRARITLHGLSFGEHDGGAERVAVSRAVGEVVRRVGVGLVRVENGPAELWRVLWELGQFCEDDVCVEGMEWGLVDVEGADDAAGVLWRAAAGAVRDVEEREGGDGVGRLEEGASFLRAGCVLLEHAAGAPTRRARVAGDAVGDVLFAAVRVQLSATDFVSVERDRGIVVEVCERALRLVCDMRRVAGTGDLAERVFVRDLFPLLGAALKAEDTQFDAPAALAKARLVPTSAVLRFFVLLMSDTARLDDILSSVFALIFPLVEDVIVSRRLHALDMLQHVLNVASEDAVRFHASPLLSALRGALTWRDCASSLACFPLLPRAVALLHARPSGRASAVHQRERCFHLDVSPSEAWSSTFRTALEVLLHHVDQRRDEASEGVETVARVAIIIPQMAHARLNLYMAVWLPLLSVLLQRVTTDICSGLLSLNLHADVVTAFVETLRWGWPRATAYRDKVVNACVASVMEARHGSDDVRERVHQGVIKILMWFAKCGQVEELLMALKTLEEEASKYPSLSAAARLFADAQAGIAADVRESKDEREVNGTGGRFGLLVSQYFSECDG